MTNNYGFGKAFGTMYSGSLVGSGPLAFALWGYVIANQAPVGQFVSVDLGLVEGKDELAVELNPKLLAVIFGETTEAEVAREIAKMCEVDAASRSPDEEGRRLVRLGQFAYWVVNGRKYRDLRMGEVRREQNRQAQERHRRKKSVPSGRERRFTQADAAGDQAESDRIASEGLP